ncbi:alpha/beta fold hydrolase [Ktedonobacter robiniae]|uniref:Hydrolase n=1 Tax=Ktedonobacter robiniae TaxID=2778365 RepID=A0ABQ3UTG9_9CHLR|nr:alpha/beta fold hydrolase [Ktedonobacter robiniae]GHO56013.1 hydrolase [Ktedonobacter robiniae]
MAEIHSQTGFLEAQGAPLYYEIAGQGDPLLLIHAGIADSRMWDEQFPAFARHYRTIRYDVRGYGQSPFPTGSFANHEDPVALLTSLGIEKAHVVGISLGGKIALDFALAHPEMVTSLVLVATSVSGAQSSELVRQFFAEEEAALERGDVEGATELSLRMWVDGPRRTSAQVNPLVRKLVHDMLSPVIAVSLPESADEIALQPSALTRLDEIHVPTLLMVGDHDLPDKLTLTRQLADQIIGAQQVIIPGVAHMVNMEQPEEFTRIVLRFLSEL